MNTFCLANRGEVAIPILRACVESNFKTVTVDWYEDCYFLHCYKPGVDSVTR